MNILKALKGNPIEKKLVAEKDTSDFSKKKILERSNEEQAEYLAILQKLIEREKNSPASSDLQKTWQANRIYFYEQQITKLKRYLSAEDFKKTQALTKNALATYEKEDSINTGISITIGSVVILLIVIGFFSIFFSGEDCMKVEYIENGNIKTGQVCGEEAMSTMKAYQSDRERNLEDFKSRKKLYD